MSSTTEDIENLRLIARTLHEQLGKIDDAYAFVRMGADGTPTSRIDAAAEKIILDTLKQKKMPYNVLSEEAGFIDNGYDVTLILDPIDGTYNASHSIPYYSVSMALGKQALSDVHAALVKDMATGAEYWAIRGKGAYRDDKKLSTKRVDMAVMALGSRAKPYLDIISRYRRVRALGSAALEMLLVAAGEAELYYYVHEPDVIRVVDIAASTLITRESGGVVLNRNLKELDMPLNLEVHRSIIAAADLDVVREVGL